MPSYLVEVYMPRSRAHEARATAGRARAAADELSREGMPVRYVRTTFLPDDETCLHLLEAETAEGVEAASSRAEMGRARIVRSFEASVPPRRKRTEHYSQAAKRREAGASTLRPTPVPPREKTCSGSSSA